MGDLATPKGLSCPVFPLNRLARRNVGIRHRGGSVLERLPRPSAVAEEIPSLPFCTNPWHPQLFSAVRGSAPGVLSVTCVIGMAPHREIHHAVSDQPLSFPTLLDEPPDRWQWPAPPFPWRHVSPPGNDVAQPCRIESQMGRTLDAEMLVFDPAGRSLTLRTAADRPPQSLSFSRFRRLTLTTPLQPAPPIAGAPAQRVPAAAQERDYSLDPDGPLEPLIGRTAGHVETPEGMYLFTIVDEEASVQRVFVPSAAYVRCEFGPSAEEAAARLWIANPSELLLAIERQQRVPVRPLGLSLLALGLLTANQLDRALARQAPDMPLGELLVTSGLISGADLQTAIAHKMGYPLVDLARFPIDAAALSKLSKHLAVSCRAIPLMLDKERLIVAVDKPSRVDKLQEVHALAQFTTVPVLAPKMQILLALDRLSGNALSQNVLERSRFFAATV